MAKKKSKKLSRIAADPAKFYGASRYVRDSIRFQSSAAQQRSPAGFQRFQTQKAAKVAAERAVAKSNKKKKPPKAALPPPPPLLPPPPPPPPTVKPNISEYQPQFDTGKSEGKNNVFKKQISGLNKQISSLTSGFQEQLSGLKTQLEEEREAAAQRMEEMQGSFAQALAQNRERQLVEGIRFADRGTGGATQQQLQRRGVRGTFGRSGERLMKISSLNV